MDWGNFNYYLESCSVNDYERGHVDADEDDPIKATCMKTDDEVVPGRRPLITNAATSASAFSPENIASILEYHKVTAVVLLDRQRLLVAAAFVRGMRDGVSQSGVSLRTAYESPSSRPLWKPSSESPRPRQGLWRCTARWGWVGRPVGLCPTLGQSYPGAG